MRQALLPLILGSQAIPSLAIAPVLVIWFGFGMEPKVIITALIVFFPVFVNTFAGFSSIERDSVSLMDSLGATQWQVFSKVRFPGSLPYIFTGLKIAATISPIGAIVGEWVGSHEGLGPVMIAANAAFKTHVVFRCHLLSCHDGNNALPSGQRAGTLVDPLVFREDGERGKCRRWRYHLSRPFE